MPAEPASEKKLREDIYAWFDKFLEVKRMRRERMMLDARCKIMWEEIGSQKQLARRLGVDIEYIKSLIRKARRYM